MKLLVLLCLLLLSISFTPVARAQSAPPAADPAQVKADLKRILQSPEFQPVKEDQGFLARTSRWFGEKWDAFWKSIRDWLRKHFGGDDDSEERGSASSNVLAAFVVPLVCAVLAIPVVWLLALLIQAFVRNWRGVALPKARTTTTFDIDEATADMVEEPDEWLLQAQKYAEANDFRRAFRAVFLGILLQLDRAGAIEYNRARTNGDYVRLLRSRNLNLLFDAFRPLVLEFDLHWYGNRATVEEDYRRCRQEYDRIRQLLAAPPQGTALPLPGRV